MTDYSLGAPLLLETISGLMSTDPVTRTQAEDQLKTLENTLEFGLHVTELTLEQEAAPPVRQMASVLLKQYITDHWSQESSQFRPPETPPAIKATLRNILPHGLKESMSEVRNIISMILATIGHWEWPDVWPQLFNILMEAIKADHQFAVQGAITVFKELSRDLTDCHVSSVAPVLLPEIYRIFCDSSRFPICTRAEVIEIFGTLVKLISTVGEVNHTLKQSLLTPVLPSFSEALVTSLRVPDSQTSDAVLKTEVLTVLAVLVRNLPKEMIDWFPQMLPAVWSTLTETAEKYKKVVGNTIANLETDNVVDGAGDCTSYGLGLENLVFAIFEFVRVMVETPKLKNYLIKSLTELMYYIIIYMEITEEEITKWNQDPESLVEDEDNNNYSSVRTLARDLLLLLCEEFEKESCVSLVLAIDRHILSLVDRENEKWWKIREAMMFALGCAHKFIKSQMKDVLNNMDLPQFFNNMLINDFKNTSLTFHLGRCVWVGSIYLPYLKQEAVIPLYELIFRHLHQDQPHTLRIFAVKAVWEMYNHYMTRKQAHDMTTEQIQLLVDELVTMASHFSNNSPVVGIILKSISIVLECEHQHAAALVSKISQLVIAIFFKFPSDLVIPSLCQNIFKILSSNTECSESLQSHLIPPLLSILNTYEDKTGLKSHALDILNNLVRSSPRPLSEPLMLNMLPAAIQVTLSTDSPTILQSGGECIRSYVSVAPDQVVAFTDNTGKSGLLHVLAVAEHLLNPVGNQHSATFVGRLVSTLIQRLGPSLGDHLELLLKSVLCKLQVTQDLGVSQSLIMVYAHLVHTQMEAALNFLSSVPDSNGDSALRLVLTEWVAKQQSFFGFYETKVSITAIGKLLQHGVNSNDTRLTEIMVAGDPVIGNGRTTRSSSNIMEWTRVPLLAKLFKLLINELQHLAEQVDHIEEDDSEEEEGHDCVEGDNSQSQGPMGDLNFKMITKPCNTYIDDLDGEDPDCKNDPIYSLDIKQYLVSYLSEFCQQPYLNLFIPHLNQQEKKTLQSLGDGGLRL